MVMTAKGLAKLIEECGELCQIAGKKMACMDTDLHWDGKGSLNERLANEIADVIAACTFVCDTFNLQTNKINSRVTEKYNLYHTWNKLQFDIPIEVK